VARPLVCLLLLAAPLFAADPTVTKLDVPAKSILPCARWTDEKGDHVYLLDGDNGALLKVAVATGKVTEKKEFGRKVGWIDESAEGLIVSVPDKGEVWVLDAKLDTKKTIEVKGLGKAASSPKLSIAAVGGAKNEPLQVLDLKAGTLSNVTTESKKVGRFLGSNPTVTPDGKTAFTSDGDKLLRFDVAEGKLTFTEVIRTGGKTRPIVVSPDSKLLAHSSGGGNPDVKPNYSTAIYTTSSLTKTECVLAVGAYPGAVGIDTAAGRIYTTNGKSQLIVFDTGGIKKGAHKIGKEEPRQFLVHPAGGKVLLVAADQVSLVEVPKE
jgi:hypothetical protein